MARISTIFSRFIIGVLFVAIAVTIHQFWAFNVQIENLERSGNQIAQQLEKAQEFETTVSSIRQEVEQLEVEHRLLMNRIPETDQLEQFHANFSTYITPLKINVLARKQASFSQPLYREYRLFYTLQGEEENIKRLLSWLKKQPRLVNIDPPQYFTNKRAEITLHLYSSPSQDTKSLVVPECIPNASDIFYQPFIEEMAQRYRDYIEGCKALEKNREMIQLLHDYQILKQQNASRQTIIDTLQVKHNDAK